MQSAAIYIRVSTDEQTEYSPEAQKRALFDYAMKNNMYIAEEHIYMDEGISGRRADKRPQFQKMINAAKNKSRPFEIILVHKFDRFARNREDSIVYKSMLLRECGVKVISVTEELSDDKTSVILEAMLEAMGEYYSLNLSEEVKKGMTIKAERGEIQTKAPIGYDMDKENKKLVINENEAQTVRYIFNEFLSCITVSRISKDLNAAGIKTKNGKLFEKRTVYYILNNPVYTGKVRWTPTGKICLDFNNSNSIIVQSNHEPIISEEDFESANKILTSRRKKYKQYNTNGKYFLSGLVKCGACGANLTYTSKNGLQCYKYNNAKCLTSHYISIKKFEKALKEKLEYDIKNNSNIYSVETEEKNKKSNNSFKTDNQIKKAEKKLERATEAYLNGIYDIEYLKKLKEEISAEISLLEKQRNYIEDISPIDTKELAQEAIKMFDENYSYAERRSIAETAIEKIIYDKANNVLILYYNKNQ